MKEGKKWVKSWMCYKKVDNITKYCKICSQNKITVL